MARKGGRQGGHVAARTTSKQDNISQSALGRGEDESWEGRAEELNLTDARGGGANQFAGGDVDAKPPRDRLGRYEELLDL